MRLLLVEDDPSTAKAIELSLASEGIICDTTELGEEGLEIGKLYDYDIIILDLMLPGLSGAEVAQAIRVRLANNAPVLIALSGSLAEVAQHKGGTLFDHALTKPVNVNRLMGILTRPP